MTLTISVRFRSAPPAAQPDRARHHAPLVRFHSGRAAAAAPDAPATARPAVAGPAAGAGGAHLDTAPAGLTGTAAVSSLLALAEPAALLVAEAAGLGLLGKVVLATAMRTAQRVIAA